MKRHILFVLGKDVHNKGTYKVYRECIKRGFQATVYASSFLDNHNYLFERDNVCIHDLNNLNEEDLNRYDYIFSAIPLFERSIFLNAQKYIFLNPSTHFDEVYFSGDFIFTARDLSKNLIEGEEWSIEKLNYLKSLPAMATGGAALEKRNLPVCNSKIILFVDAGHFPFGTKQELVEYIIEIAKYCPEYTIRVKPRYLPSDKNTTHTNKENIFDYFNNQLELPLNLELIHEHTDFGDELEKAELVICPEGTTSYEEVILAGKNLLIFTGFPNKDNVLWPESRIKMFNKIPANLHNRVYYKDIFQYLPKGIATSLDDLRESLYRIEHVAESIVDAMEYIFSKYISCNVFPKKDYYKTENYSSIMHKDSMANWDTIKKKRYKSLLYDLVAEKMSILCAKIDCTKIVSYIEDNSRQLVEEHFNEEKEKLCSILNELLIQNQNEMKKSQYAQSVLCMAYYKKNMLNKINYENLKCATYLAYCFARIEYDKNNYLSSLKYIDKYFEEVNKNKYDVSLADDAGVKAMAHYYKGAALFKLKKYCEAEYHLKLCNEYWNGKHEKATEFLRSINKMLDEKNEKRQDRDIL